MKRQIRILVALAGTAFAGSSEISFAQKIASNPYAPLETTKPVWPPFYKPVENDAAYQTLMANGWCKPNGWRAKEYYQSKLLDINALPQTNFKGTIASKNGGLLTATDEKSGKTYTLIVHDNQAISNVRLNGKVSVEAMKPGDVVRFVTRVDSAGNGLEPIRQIELFTPSRDQLQAVEPNRLQNCVGKILRCDGDRLVVQPPPGKINRVSVVLAPEVEITARIADHLRADVGDAVTAKGRVFHSTVINQTLFFADELDIAAVKPLGTKIASTK